MNDLPAGHAEGSRFSEPSAGHRDWYSFEAIRTLPRILTLLDKNPNSATYGCFDREYWHYRTIDFPCGMSQEMVLPLALVYTHPFPNNPYYRVERLKELAVAGIEFAKKSSHSDGTCDDYFPFERALGAHVFSTYAMSETYRVLGLDRPDLVDFFRLRGDWLAEHNETGQLANHQAFAALALYNVFLLTGDEKYRAASNQFRDITLSWQHGEGWFQEYEGADPGYHSCSIAFLSKLFQKSNDESLLEPLRRAVDFAQYFMHPDGSYAGEYGSRNTYHFYPHGFEVMSRYSDAAARIAETFLRRAMPERRRYFNEDNRMLAHYTYDWLQSHIDYNPKRKGLLEEARGPFTKWFADAKLFVKKTKNYYAVTSLAKGGVIKVFDDRGPLYSDTGLIAETTDGDVIVSHLVDETFVTHASESSSEVHATGPMSKRKYHLPSPVKQMAFRGMNLTVGRYNASLVRSTLQKVLITGKPRTEVSFSRRIEFSDSEIVIFDRIDARSSKATFKRLAAGSDATSIYVANSNTFQESTLCPWVDLSGHVDRLNRERVLDLPPRRVKMRG
jgi:hypothetical protein